MSGCDPGPVVRIAEETPDELSLVPADCVSPASDPVGAMSGKNKWTPSSGRWKSSGTSGQVREAPKAPEPEVRPQPQSLAERLPTFSDAELLALQANAKRVSENAKDKKAVDAAELLPLIATELAQRVVLKAAAGVERKKDMAAKRAAVKARKIATTAAEAEGAAEDEAERR